MHRLTTLALLVPCVLTSGVALAQPIPEAGPSDPPPTPGWDQPSPDQPTPRPAPWEEVPPELPDTPEAPAYPDASTSPPTLSAPNPSGAPFALYATRPPVAGALYLQGFDLSWEARPHRLHSLVVVADAGAQSAAMAPTGALLTRVQGGSWANGVAATDTATVKLAYGGLSSERTPIYRGAIRANVTGDARSATREPAIVVVPVDVPLQPATGTTPSTPGTGTGMEPGTGMQPGTGMGMEPGTGVQPGTSMRPRDTPRGAQPGATAPGTYDPAQGAATAPQSPYDGAAVFLQGLAIETDAAHPDGFTPHVLSVKIGPATVAEGVAHFDVTIEIQAAAVPDRDQRLGNYGAEVEVGWLLVPAAASRVHRLETSGGASHGIEIDASPTTGEPVPLAVGVDLRPGTTEVAAGLTGFRVAIDQTGLDAGRYLRSLGVSLDASTADPWRGRWDGTVAARFSNAGPVTRAEAVTLEAEVTVLELEAGQHAWSGRWIAPASGTEQQLAYPGPARTGRR
ncbi:MAG: hypothetical protein Q8P41_21465 [Pseudomonadota bacterium]|nr:hypothetical protein [Pseudomonadota bacterium]